MKKILWASILSLFMCFPIFGQDDAFQKPDYQKIQSVTGKQSSEYYYPQLFERYRQHDTTLNHKDYRMLYYGYLFHPEYSPDTRSEYRDSLKSIYDQQKLNAKDFRKIIEYEKQILELHPFSMRDLNTLAYCYSQTGKQEKSRKVDYKLNLIIETILSSGDGLEEESAWHVINVSHEYDLLDVLGMQVDNEQHLRKEGYDYLKIEDNKYGISGFYFNVGKLLETSQ